MKLGRNDPCHCGSGKKYKSCHQRIDEQNTREERSLRSLAEWVAFHRARLAERVGDEPFEQPLGEQFLAQLELSAAQITADDLARDVVLYDLHTASGAVIEGALRSDDEEDRRTLARVLASSVQSIFEVTECKRGKGVRLQDRFTGRSYFVAEPALSAQLEPLEYVIGRMLVLNQNPVLLTSWEKIDFRGRKKLVETLRAEGQEAGVVPGAETETQAWQSWLKANAAQILQRTRAARPAV